MLLFTLIYSWLLWNSKYNFKGHYSAVYIHSIAIRLVESKYFLKMKERR